MCIDDFALKKRERYGTIMVDMDTHCILDMIASRDYTDVMAWLKTFPNIQIVSRDGSVTYRNAITAAHPNAAQVSDRFHLLKNLTSYAMEYLRKQLKQRITINQPGNFEQSIESISEPSQSDVNRQLTMQEKYIQIELLIMQGKKKSQICKKLNIDIRTFDKLMCMKPEERSASFQTKSEKLRSEHEAQRLEQAKTVHKLKGDGLSNSEISRRTGFSTAKIQKYLDKNYSSIHASTGIKKNGNLIPYMKHIDSYLERGAMGTVIETQIRDKGYDGSTSNLRHYIADWKRRRKQIKAESSPNVISSQIIERTNLFKLLFKPIDKVKSISEEQFLYICRDHPCFKAIHSIVWQFKTLMSAKDLIGLEKWIDKTKELGISEITSFANGLVRDWDAVRNAIVSPFSNGLAEGSVNKLKVIKRVMYGRCSFDTLRTKTLRLEKMRKIN